MPLHHPGRLAPWRLVPWRLVVVLSIALAPAVIAQNPVVLVVLEDGSSGDDEFESISDALDAVPKTLDAAYVIEIRDDGTYEERVVVNKNTSASNTLTIRAQEGQNPTVVAAEYKKPAIQVKSPYVTIEDLQVRGGNRSVGIHLLNADHGVVRRCTVWGATHKQTPGIYIHNGRGNQIVDNEIRDNVVGVQLLGAAGQDNVLRNNRIHSNRNRGLWLFRTIARNQILNNTFYDNGVEIQLGNNAKAKDEPGTGNVFRNNVVVAGGDGVCFLVKREGGPKSLPDDTQSDYNTLYAGADGAVVASLDGDELDLDGWQAATGADGHSLAVDPQLVDAPSDLHLQSTTGSYHDGDWIADAEHSPAIDAGDPAEGVGDEPAPNGGRINMGAYGATAQASRSAAVAVAKPQGAIELALTRSEGTGATDIVIEVSHRAGLDTRAKIEWSADRGGPYAAAALRGPAVADVDDSGGPPDVNNGNAYQVGSGSATRIVTDEGSNTVAFLWDSAADLPDGDGTFVLRLTANDDAADQETPHRARVEVDNVEPEGLSDLAGTAADPDAITWSWTPVSAESHFDAYTIWHGTNRADVLERGGTAVAWTASQDNDLGKQATSSTTVTGLARGTEYHAQIWARDGFGNEASAAIASYFTAGLDTVTHYVAKSGERDGTPNDPDDPWNSIVRALDAIPKNVARSQSNYVVQIQDSETYQEQVVVDKDTDASYSVLLRPLQGQTPRLRAKNGKDALVVESDYAIIEGLVVEASNKSAIELANADHVIIRDCELRGDGKDATLHVLQSDYNRIEANRIYGSNTAVELARDADGNMVRNNLILDDNRSDDGRSHDDRSDYAVYIGRDADTDTLLHNTIVGYEHGLFVLGGKKGAGDDHVLHNNIFHDVEVAIHLEDELGNSLAHSDYNDLHPDDDGSVGHIDGTDYETLAAWRTATGLDANSLSQDPQFADASGDADDMDLHLRSPAGRWDGSGWVSDLVASPAIDAGDPQDPFGIEPAPNGNRVNLGAYGNTMEASKSGPLTVVLGGIPYEQYVQFGVPLIPVDGNPDVVLGDDFPGEGEDPWGFWWRLVRWDTAAGGYVYYKEEEGLEGDPPDLAPGRGFWLIQWWSLFFDDGSTEGDTVTVTGTPVSLSEDFVVPLEVSSVDLGVNQVANPFLFDIDWADAKVRDNGNGRVASVARAARAGLIDGHAYLWDWEDEDYLPVSPEDGGRIDVWRGFWIEQLDLSRDLDLLLPPVQAGRSVSKIAATQPAADDWFVEFSVATVGRGDDSLRDANNRAGVKPEAAYRNDPYDALDLPGLAQPYLSAYFPHDDPAQSLDYWPDRPGRYTYDMRDADWLEQEWVFVVETDLVATSLLWTWSNPDQLPRGFRLSLEEADTDSVLIADLSLQTGYAFDSGLEGRRRLRLRAEYDDVTGDVNQDRLIDAMDATDVLRHAIGLETLPDFALPYAEVSGNAMDDPAASVTPYDAAWILRFAQGLVSRFPIDGGEVPAPTTSSPAVYLGEPRQRLDRRWEIPIVLTDADEVLSGVLALAYDTAELAVEDALLDDAFGDYEAAHIAADGRAEIAFAGARSLRGSVTLAKLVVQPHMAAADLLEHLRIETVQLNEGGLSATVLPPRPETYLLLPPAPNPFNSSVTLRFGIPVAGEVEVAVYNSLGQRLRRLTGGRREAGMYQVVWDGRDEAGRVTASGVYFVRLEAGGLTLTQKAALIR